MYKNVIFYENECVPVYVTSSSYKMTVCFNYVYYWGFFFTINYTFTSDQDKQM